MSTDLEYTIPTDELPIVWSLNGGIAAAGYPLAKLTNDNPADPFKLDSQSVALQGTLPAPAPVACAALIHHNFDPGKHDLYLMAGTVPGAPTYFQAFPAVPPRALDGFPVNLLLDLRPLGPLPIFPYWYFVSYPGYGAWTPNSVPISIGELKLYSDVHAIDGSLVVDLRPTEQEGYPLIDHVTEGDVSMVYPYGTKRRALHGGILQAGDAAVQVQQWYRATRGRALPFLVLVTEAEGAEVAEPWLCRFEKSALDRTFTYGSVMSTFDLAIEEISRGLRPTPSPALLTPSGLIQRHT
jgi:hypothetical protein